MRKKSKFMFGEIGDVNDTHDKGREFLKLHSYRPKFLKFHILETLHKPSD